MGQVDFARSMNHYKKAIKNNNRATIEKAKYDLLWEASNYFELVRNYIACDQEGIKFDFGKDIIPKGTILYRIRAYSSDTDFSKSCEWAPPPGHPQNRANFQGQEALYLGSTEEVCLIEAQIEKNGKYVLATYTVIDDIEVGGYLLEKNNTLHNYAGMILNAFLITPARSDKNIELLSYLKSLYGEITLDDLTDVDKLGIDGAYDLPMKFCAINRCNQFYDFTNQLCSILARDTPSGIRYSSCYFPLETIGIECSHYNLVLYHEGIQKIKFTDYVIKTNARDFSGIDILKRIYKGKI